MAEGESVARPGDLSAALRRQTIIWDSHACMPLRPGDTRFLPQLERVRQAGVTHVSLNVGFDLSPTLRILSVLATFRRWLQEHRDSFILADTVEDIERAKTEGKLAVTFDLEGGSAVEAHPGLVEIYYRLGVRWMALTYNRNNRLGGGCMDDDGGLTDRGRQVIAEMERVGMVLCCSHLGATTARQAIDASRNPAIFSHSNAASVFPHVRNIDDEVMAACAARGGVVNISGVGVCLGRGATGAGDNSIAGLVRHIDHAVQRIGADHVGLGLDYIFDLSELDDYLRDHPEDFPAGVRPGTYSQIEHERLPAIADRLISMGYGEADVQGILGHNNLRVARQVWRQ